MKIGIVSQGVYSPSGTGITTGFSKAAYAISTNLAKNNAVNHLAIGYHGLPYKHENGFTVSRNNVQPWKDASELQLYVESGKFDTVITEAEVWYTGRYGGIDWGDTKSIYHLPIDGFPLDKNVQTIKNVPDLIVPMTQFGKKVMEAESCACYDVIPLSYNPEFYYEFKKKQKAEAREKLGFSDEFIVQFVGRHQERKNLMALIIAFEQFAKDKDNAILMLTITSDSHRDFNLVNLIKYLGISDKVKIAVIRDGDMLTDQELGNIYNISDIYFSTSCYEGFNLCTLESQACGVPNIIPNYSAHVELVEGHGELIEIDSYKKEKNGIHSAYVSIPDAVEKLNSLYESSAQRRRYGSQARKFAENYTDEKIQPWWNNLIDNLDDAIEDVDSRKDVRMMQL